ncbi:MAG: tRNA epoxyqueuosine(34) reductase QueG [Pirellulaceae bacterium]|nr:tRNA epoxyqueuosine(34) reductase QueG [Pirellulaceae bacterium]
MTAELKQCARDAGFALVGACPAVDSPGMAHLERFLAAGYAGEMDYLADRLDAYRHPSGILPGVRSLLMLAMTYRTLSPRPAGPGQGRVSCYAWGHEDYHTVIRRGLDRLGDRARALLPGVRTRGVVDTAPLLEREFARLAGLGWIGKHTLLLNRQLGSWFFLAAMLLDCELVYDEPFRVDHCGSCSACLNACPTQAFPAPYVLDATRCISYLTIEARGAMPREARAHMQDWVFGCDVCQDVCPWNRFAPTDAAAFVPRDDLNPLDLPSLFELDDDAFRALFRHTPLWRARRRGLLRNAAIALGNRPVPDALPALLRGLHDPDAIVRGACVWAVGQYEQPGANQALMARFQVESDPAVREEISRQLSRE